MADHGDASITIVALSIRLDASSRASEAASASTVAEVSSGAALMCGSDSRAVWVGLTLVDPTPDASTSGRSQFSTFMFFQAHRSSLWACTHIPDAGHKACTQFIWVWSSGSMVGYLSAAPYGLTQLKGRVFCPRDSRGSTKAQATELVSCQHVERIRQLEEQIEKSSIPWVFFSCFTNLWLSLYFCLNSLEKVKILACM